MSYLCALDIILNTGSNKNISFYYLIEEVLVNWRSRNLDIICWFFLCLMMLITYKTILKHSYMIHKNAKSMIIYKNLLI